MGKQLSYEELIVLLDQSGFTVPVEFDALHFPLPANALEKQKVLDAGSTKLAERQDDGVQILVQVLAQATAVVQTTLRKEATPDQHRWHFSNGAKIVSVQAAGESDFVLDHVADKGAAMAEIEQFIPLQPAPETLNYRVKIDEEDFHTLSDLASAWEEVPALEILEADGLDQIAARDLFDSAVEPEWRGIIVCLTYQGQTLSSQATIRALQGAEVSWIIRPSTAGKVIAETARQGHFQKALSSVMDSLG
jgi:hypothetical protein